MLLPVDPALYAAYFAAMAVMAVTPGPANVFCVAIGMQRGKRAALSAVAGMNAATLVWYLAAALGLSALVHAFPAVFRVIAVLGGLYVAWLGIQSIRSAWAKRAAEASRGHAPAKITDNAFRDGFMVQIANPKIVVFFSAVLPPFLDGARPVAPQLALFGATTVGLDAIAMAAYGLGGAALSARMQDPRFARAFGTGVGVLLLTTAGLILSRP
jgi:threonine/homoserine/homoserine lactone efflux protein